MASCERNSCSMPLAFELETVLERQLPADVDAALDRGDRHRRAGSEPRDVLVERRLVGEDAADEAQRLRLVGRDLAAGEQQLERGAAADLAGEALRAAVAGQQPERHLGRAQPVLPASA